MTHDKKISGILKKTGPLLSNEITQKLCSKYKLSEDAAAQALSRVSAPICRIDNINFPHNRKFFYLNPFNYKDKNTLYKYCNEHKTAQGLILNASRNQVVSATLLKVF